MTDFTGSGWSFPFSIEPTGAMAMAAGTTKLEQSMRLILETYPGERPMRPYFGSTLRDFVFDSTSHEKTAEIAEAVRQAIEQWEPRVDVAQVDVYPDEDQPGLLYIDIRYVVPSENSPRNLVFPFYTIPENEEGEY